MSTQLAVVSFQEMKTLADAVVKSGLFGMKTADQALTLMALAQAEGIHPMTAVRDYHIIQGRPSLKADTLLARFQQDGGIVEWKEYTDTRVTGIFHHPKKCPAPVAVTWTIDQARKITSHDRESGKQKSLTDKDNWRNYPKAMLRARVISEGVRTVNPGVCVGMYTVEEAVDIDYEPVSSATTIKASVTPPEEVAVIEHKPAETVESAPVQDAVLSELTGMPKIEVEPIPQKDVASASRQQQEAADLASTLIINEQPLKTITPIVDAILLKIKDKCEYVQGCLVSYTSEKIKIGDKTMPFTTYVISDLGGHQAEIVSWQNPVTPELLEQGATVLFEDIEVKEYRRGGKPMLFLVCKNTSVVKSKN